MDVTEISFEIVNKSHLPDLVELYHNVFGKKVDVTYFEIKFGLFDESRFQCSTVARYKGQVIGFYGAYLVEYCDNSRKSCLKVINTFDFILLESYRGKRIFDHLYAHTLELVRREKVDYMFGFHSEQTYKFSARMGWEDTAFFSRFHLSLFPKNVSKTIRKIGGENQLRKRLEKALSSYLVEADLEALNRVEGKYTQKYDDMYFSTKNFCPHYLVKIANVVMWLKYDRTITCGIVKPISDVDPGIFLAKLKSLLKQVGIDELVFHVQNDSNEYLWLSQNVSMEPSFKISFLKISDTDVPFSALNLNFMDMDIF